MPLPIGLKLEKNLEQASLKDINLYQQEIGSLIYTTIFTRPDLVYPINFLARFISNSSVEHYKYLNNIWCYLNKTQDLALDLTIQSSAELQLNKLNKTSNLLDSINLIGSSDSDWGSDLDTRKLTTGNIFCLQNNKNNNKNSFIAISWLSKLQKTVAISSAKAKYIALKEATKESLYLQSFIKELSISNIKDISNLFYKVNIIKTDSLSAIELAKNPIYYARTKHVDITYYFVRENLLERKIDLVYKSTNSLLADNLTKPTNNPKYYNFIKDIGLVKLI